MAIEKKATQADFIGFFLRRQRKRNCKYPQLENNMS